MSVKPRLTLVGAGPGDPELITLKGMRVLAEADVVLYDALSNKDMLRFVRPEVPTISVGKTRGCHRISQEEINVLIVELVRQYGHVVRLKGGDPFVFARGYEECRFAESYGIPTEVIPGVTSVVAIPELHRIPLTCRGVSESFWVVTGTTSSGRLSQDVFDASRSSATVVILMGMHRLQEILEVFERAGKANTPVAIIQSGTTSEEKTAVGRVSTIVHIAAEKRLRAPAVIVIGDVVALGRIDGDKAQVATREPEVTSRVDQRFQSPLEVVL